MVRARTVVDSGEPRCRRKIVSTTILPTAMNSLCQFWSDWNQKVDVVTNSTVLTARRP
jgi:hypothetical protein